MHRDKICLLHQGIQVDQSDIEFICRRWTGIGGIGEHVHIKCLGELRYPYGLALLPDGSLVVCEYGNNRLQVFSPEGRSLAVYGAAGRGLGQLAYPWGVAVDAEKRACVVDAGNNRIQVWKLR